MRALLVAVSLVAAVVAGVIFGPQLIQLVGAGCQPGAQRGCDCPGEAQKGFQYCAPEGSWSKCLCLREMMRAPAK